MSAYYQSNMFEVMDSFARLDKAGDPLQKLTKHIRWYRLEKIIKPIFKTEASQMGRPSWDIGIILRCLLLQALYNLSDDSCEYQINDRISFKRFIGIDVNAKAPDAKTLWHYREKMIALKLDQKLWIWLEEELTRSGYRAKKGQMIDASFVEVPRRACDEKDFDEDDEDYHDSRTSQLDPDASYTKKNSKTYYGYKMHVQADVCYKLVRNHCVTSAHVHDSQCFEELLDDEINSGRDVYADSAYRSEAHESLLRRKGLQSKIHYRAYRNKGLSAAKVLTNSTRSKVRVRIEHIFGHIHTAMGGIYTHVVGRARVGFKVSLKLLAYNLHRYSYFERRKMASFGVKYA